MNDQIKSEQNDSIANELGEAFSRIIRQAVKQELNDATSRNRVDEADCWLTVEETAQILKVSEDWIYDNARKLPFMKKLGPKMLRSSLRGLQTFMESRMGRS